MPVLVLSRHLPYFTYISSVYEIQETQKKRLVISGDRLDLNISNEGTDPDRVRVLRQCDNMRLPGSFNPAHFISQKETQDFALTTDTRMCSMSVRPRYRQGFQTLTARWISPTRICGAGSFRSLLDSVEGIRPQLFVSFADRSIACVGFPCRESA